MYDVDARHRVLLIDDSEDIHQLVRRQLRHEGVIVESAMNGVEGLERARQSPPSLILLDVGMPLVDGFEVLRALKEDPATASTPVVMISGSRDSADKVLGLDLGALDYVCKPFDVSEMRARVRSALRISELVQLLEHRAQIDGLTGLWNRAYFQERLMAEVSASRRSGRPLSLVLFDLDFFKSINDTFGHLAGDMVLKGVASLLRRSVRQEDVACRFGGEEFGLIVRDVAASQAAQAMDRMRMAIAEIKWPRHPETPVTASFGVCDGASAADSIESWIESADRALYRAKSNGRNRVCVALASKDPALSTAV